MQKTEISTSPSFSFTCENTLLHFSFSVTSRGKAIIFSLDLDISSNKFSLLAEIATFHPSWANFSAKDFPIPLLAPVIQIVLLFI